MFRVGTTLLAACLLVELQSPSIAEPASLAKSTPDQVSAARHSGPSTSRSCLPPALKDVLATIETRFGPVRVVSTHRPGARIAGTNHASLHATCRAVDFHPAPGKYREVLAYVRAEWTGGIGIYSGKQHHLHLDVGHKKTWFTHVPSRNLASAVSSRRAAAHEISLMNHN